MTDAEIDDLIQQACRQEVRRAVRTLLTGNDTRCFTTDQYVETRVQLERKRCGKSQMWLVDGLYGNMSDGRTLAEYQITTFAGDLVHQLKPGLWVVRQEGR